MGTEVRIHWRAAFRLTKRKEETGTKRALGNLWLWYQGMAPKTVSTATRDFPGRPKGPGGKKLHHRLPSLLCIYFCLGKIIATLKVKTYKGVARTQGQGQYRSAKILHLHHFSSLSPSITPSIPLDHHAS